MNDDISNAKQTLDNLVADKTKAYFESLYALGMSADAIKNYVKEWDNE